MGRRAFLSTSALLLAGGGLGISVRGARRGIWGRDLTDPRSLLPSPETVTTLADLVPAALLAPSAHNSQPWAFQAHGPDLTVHLDLSRTGGALDVDLDEAYLSIGCALEALRLAGSACGLPLAIALLPDPDQLTLVARLTAAGAVQTEASGPDGLTAAGPARLPDDSELFQVLPERRTDRGPFLGPESEGAVVTPPNLVEAQVGTVRWLDGGAGQQIAALSGEAAEFIATEPSLGGAALRWMHLDPDRPGNDGFGPEDLGLGRLGSARLRFFSPPLPSQQLELWARGVGTAGEGGRWGALYGPPAAAQDLSEHRRAQVRAGMGWLRASLRLAEAGLSVQPVTTALRVARWGSLNGIATGLEDRLESILGGGPTPDLLFRVGTSVGGTSARAGRRPAPDLWSSAG